MNDMQQTLKRKWLWVFQTVFVLAALYFHRDEAMFVSEGPYSLGKPIVWLILIAFLIYTLRISSKENFFKSLKETSSVTVVLPDWP
jgi:hypothetical protein